MKIQIYGTGCAKCVKLAENAAQAVKQLGLDAEIVKITDINAITNAGIMMTPALGVDDKVVSVGKVLSPEEIAKLLKGEETPASSCESGSCCCSSEKSQAGAPCCSGGGKGKKILTVLLLALVVFSVVAVIMRETQNPASKENVMTPVVADAVTVYYFHGNQRCFTCNKIEELTKEAVNGKYADELAEGKISLRSINVELPENEHFIKDFQLSTRSVVMQKGEKHEKFDAVWTLVREPAKFTEYIQNGVDKMLME